MATSDRASDGLAAIEAKLTAHQARHADTARQANQASSSDRQLPEQKLEWKFLTPLIWAPMFPIIRHSSSRLPPFPRGAMIGTAILIANLHGFWLINNPDLSDEALGIQR